MPFPTTLHLYHRPRHLGRRGLYLGVRQGEQIHAISQRRFHKPHITLHDHLDKTQRLATIERLAFQQARVWTSDMPPWHVHSLITTSRHPARSTWGFTTTTDLTDSFNQRFHTDMYEWRPTRLSGEVPRQLGIVIGWALLRKDRFECQHQPESPLHVIERKEEVVAVAGHTSPSTKFTQREMPRNEPCSLGLEKERLFTLRFLGKGRTGELGQGWEVYAVITWLGLWHRI